MWPNPTKRRILQCAAAVSAAGMLFGATCTSDGIRAVAAGLEAATTQLNHEYDDDISFGDWLLDELDDIRD